MSMRRINLNSRRVYKMVNAAKNCRLRTCTMAPVRPRPLQVLAQAFQFSGRYSRIVLRSTIRPQ
uniref:Uncharacterized protein n=1 Tax=Arundo donax TaxID=35708 RepID=A0A0A9A4B2_ARUDO